jgi:DNA invertase Pin-like site-specific DNA recombinase
MLIGYARVSTEDQNLCMQEDALKTAGCEEIFQISLVALNHLGQALENALTYSREGDTLVVWKLDRLGRSLQHLIQIIAALNQRKIGAIVMKE